MAAGIARAMDDLEQEKAKKCKGSTKRKRKKSTSGAVAEDDEAHSPSRPAVTGGSRRRPASVS